jgi:phosphotransferase system HPr-like phosphotransfer protein
VLMLAAARGTIILVRTEGDEAQACADAISELFDKGFNEQIA